MTHCFGRGRWWRASPGVLALIGLAACGCQRASPARRWTSPYPGPRTLAVAPFSNQSGSEFLDVMAVTDEFYAELQSVEGLTVAPVNRVLAGLEQLGLVNVRSPAEALALVELLEIDGMIVGSVTQYDAYPPPRVGMAVQLYLREQAGGREGVGGEAVNPGEMARAARPFELAPGRPIRPRNAVVRIYDADQEEVVKRIKEYARSREGKGRPYRWETYTTSRNYLRFVSHEIIGELLAQERALVEGAGQGGQK